MRATSAIACVVLASVAPGGHASADLVVNGDFETGDFSNWAYTSQDGYSFVDGGFVHGGDYAAWFGDLQEDGGGSISQTLATTAGTAYVLSFWFAGDGDTPSGLTAIVGGNTLYEVTNPPLSFYDLYTFDFVASGTSTLLEFDAYDDPSYINLDDVSVIPAAVPEPASMAFLGIGAAILASYTGFRRRKPSGVPRPLTARI